MSDPYRPNGSWGDLVVLPDGRIAWVYVSGTTIVCEIDGAIVQTIETKRGLAVIRAAVDPADGSIMAIAHSAYVALLIRGGKFDVIGTVAGDNPVAITSAAAYVAVAPNRIRIVPFDGSPSTVIPAPWVWSSQGIRDVLPDGTIVSSDDTYKRQIDGHNFGEFQQRQGWTAGQSGFGIGILVNGIFQFARVPMANQQNRGVHGARAGNRFAVCAWTERGAYYQSFALPLGAQVDPNPPVINVPPTMEPIPMPANQIETVRRVRAKYPTPLGARHWEFMVEVAQATGTLLYRKDGGDHVLIPALNRYVSLDVVGRGALGDNWADILGDAEGAAVPAWDVHPNAAGEYLDVSGIALPGTPAPVPAPQPTPTPNPPTPAPAPTPAPSPTLPSYHQFVDLESWVVEAAYKKRTGHGPAISDMYHHAYRRLVEGWTHQEILTAIEQGK